MKTKSSPISTPLTGTPIPLTKLFIGLRRGVELSSGFEWDISGTSTLVDSEVSGCVFVVDFNCALGLSGVEFRGMTVKEFGFSSLGWITELTGSVELLFCWDRAVLCLSLSFAAISKAKGEVEVSFFTEPSTPRVLRCRWFKIGLYLRGLPGDATGVTTCLTSGILFSILGETLIGAGTSVGMFCVSTGSGFILGSTLAGSLGACAMSGWSSCR